MGILTLTCFLSDVNARLDAKPVFSASTAVVSVSRYQKEFLATLLKLINNSSVSNKGNHNREGGLDTRS